MEGSCCEYFHPWELIEKAQTENAQPKTRPKCTRRKNQTGLYSQKHFKVNIATTLFGSLSNEFERYPGARLFKTKSRVTNGHGYGVLRKKRRFTQNALKIFKPGAEMNRRFAHNALNNFELGAKMKRCFVQNASLE